MQSTHSDLQLWCLFYLEMIRPPWGVKLLIFPYPSVKTFVLGAQETQVSSSTHNICFG